MPLLEGWQEAMPGLADSLRQHVPELIRCSPLSRCLLPAEVLGRLLGVPVHVDPRLIELDFGAWEGRNWDDVPRAALECWAADPQGFAPPGGESGAALIHRMHSVRDELVASASDVLVVSHGGPLRLLGPMLRGRPPDLMAPPPAFMSLEMVQIP